uniref:Large proline-rich protein BAG6 n=1 Tax=Denticeps clupeoides TaxID=299321 RepID=A0AAY4DJT8_9TELE
MEDAGTIDVTVKTLDSQSRSYSVSGELTVKEFKEHIASSVEIPVDKQRLIYQGRVLQDDRTLNDYNVGGKVIHLVERAPPQTTQSSGGENGVPGSSGGPEGGPSAPHTSTSASPGAPHDRNGNSYVMLGTFNLPQMMAGVGEAGRNTRVTTATGTNGSVDVHINMDQSVQSEPRLRLQMAENLLREIQSIIHRLEGPSAESNFYLFFFLWPVPVFFPSPSHPSPTELVEVLSEVRRVEERLRPFMERTHSILGAASSADYNNNTQEREEDQRTLNLIGESLRLLGNTLIALSDLRCNLAAQPPRHLHTVRPISHYSSPVLLQSGMPHIPIPMNLGTTVTMTSNGRQAAEGQSQTSSSGSPSEQAGQGQGPSQAPNGAGQPGQGPGTPRVIRITHQTMEPVVMMQMNLDSVYICVSPTTEHVASMHVARKLCGTTRIISVPGLPPEFMQAIVHQISQQAVAMAAAASAGHQGPQQAPSNGEPPAPQPQARVVITRPSFSPRIPQPTTRGATINLRATVPPSPGQQPGQGPPLAPSALTQMVSGLVGQLLMPMSTGSVSFSTPTSTAAASPPASSPSTSAQTSTHTTSTASTGQAQEGNLATLLGSLFGGAAAAGGGVSAGSPAITVTVPGVPAFIHGMTDFSLQAGQPVFPPPDPVTPPAPPAAAPAPPQPPSGGGETLSPELFTGIVQGVLSTMMGSLGAGQGNSESIAQFIQRLSQTSNLFTPGAGDAVGFFGDLLSLVCQSISMVDMVLLLHGNPQPLGRIQPQLSAFFTEHYLQGREPTDANIAVSGELINGLEEYMAESFAGVTVRDGVDIVQTNMSFLRQQFTRMAAHVLRCTDETFGPRLLFMCTQGLFECLALNLYCLRGEHRALTAVVNHRIRRMSAEVNPSLVNWLTSMMSMRLHVILEHNPVTEDQIQHYVTRSQVESDPVSEQSTVPTHCSPGTRSPAPATTAEEAMASSGDSRMSQRRVSSGDAAAREESGAEVEPWVTTVPPEWVPIIRHDMLSQRKMKAQPPLSDAYLHGMPAKRRKTAQSNGPHLSLSQAVSRAARAAGVQPVTPPDSLQGELEAPELQEAYAEQVRSDLKKRVSEDPDYSSQRFPNSHRAFSGDPV